MKKTVKFLLTGILTFTSLGLVSVNNKDVKNGFVESTNDIVGEKINVGKKNAKSTTTTDDFVVGESLRITNAVAQRKVDDKGTTVRFVAAAKAENLADGIIGGELGFHVRYNRSETEVVNKYVAVESVYKSMVAGDTTYTNTKMGDFLVSTGLGEASNPNGYDVFITYSITEIPSTHLNTEFEVQPFFMKTGEETREFASGTKKANATGYTLKVGNGNAISLKDATDEKEDKDTWVNQYKAEGLSVKAGDKLVFTVDGKEVKPGASGEGNNATFNNETKEVTIVNDATNVTIYLKTFDDGGYDIWVTGYVPTEDETNIKTISVTKNWGWDDLHVYMFNSLTDDKKAEWPGEKLTNSYTNDYNQTVYTFEFDTKKYDTFIINGKENGADKQTVDIKFSSLNDKLGVYFSSWNSNLNKAEVANW